MNIFITGITGFVGTSLVNHLVAHSNDIVYGHSREQGGAKLKFKDFPVSIQPAYSAWLSDQLQIDIVIHLAGIAHDLSNQYKADDYENVNVTNTVRTFDAFLKSKAKKFIFLSSIKAVVDVADQPVDENTVPHPVTDYGRSKLKAEQYLLSKVLPAGKFVYILRPAMIHGPGNKGNLNLLYKFVRSGMPWPLGKFHNQRSFLSIDNFNFILDYLLKENVPSGVYNLADSGLISTTELVKQIGLALNRKIPVWNFPISIINSLALVTGQESRLNKLTENMMVLNTRIVALIGQPLPVSLQEGITKTIRSFDK